MRNSHNHAVRLMCGAATVAILALAPHASMAAAVATASDAPGATLEEVTVTARRVQENLQNVPVAVTALTADRLAATDIMDVETAAKQIPGLDVFGTVGAGGTPSSGGTASLTFLRGLPGVVGYFDGVPRSPGGYAALFDVQNMQVLKGPQGTLFGLASNAGAIVIEPQLPGTTFGGYVNASVGDFSRRSIEGAVDMPLADGKVLVRLAAESFYRAGWVTDITNNVDLGRQDYYILRPTVTFKLTDNIENTLLFQFSHSNDTPMPEVPYDFNFSPTAQFPTLGIEALFNGGSRPAFDALRDQILAKQKALGPYKLNGTSVGCAAPIPVSVPVPVTSLNGPVVACPLGGWTKDYLAVNTTTWGITDNLTLKNIFGYQWGSSFSEPTDFDESRLIIVEGNARNNHATKSPTTWSDELQLNGHLGDLKFIGGVFTDQTFNHPVITFSTIAVAPSNTATLSKNSSNDWSAYIQGDYDLSKFISGLSATAGYRYSTDIVRAQNFGINGTTFAVTSVSGGPGSPSGYAKFSQGSYTLGLQYKINPDVMVFITNSKGYSSGGLQNVAGFPVFQPDSLNNIEAGVKSTFNLGDVRMRLNASAYYGFFDNVKVQSVALVTNSAGVQTTTVVTQNAATAVIKGLEAEATAVFPMGVELGGFIALADDKFTDFPSINPFTLKPIDLSNTQFSDIPPFKIGVRGTYHLPMDQRFGDVSISGNYTYQPKMYASARAETRTDPTNPNTGLICTRSRTAANGYGPLSADGGTVYVDCQPPKMSLDASLIWNDVLGHRGLRASLIVTNLTNREDGDHTPIDSSLGVESLETSPPRMIVLGLGYRF